jgi:hypothetical protein
VVNCDVVFQYRLSFPGVKRPGHGGNHPATSSAEVKERVELYLYSPSGPSWPVTGRTYLYLYVIRNVTGYSIQSPV